VSADFESESSFETDGVVEIDSEPAARIAQLVQERKFCAAARLYSEMTGADVVESKLAIDRLAHKHGLAPLSGCASQFALILALISAGAWGLIRLFASLV